MQPWVQTLCGVLGAGVQQRSLWGAQLEALRGVQGLVVYFSRHMEGSMPALLAHCWRMYTEGLALFERMLVEVGACHAAPSALHSQCSGPCHPSQ